jgi:glucokinase
MLRLSQTIKLAVISFHLHRRSRQPWGVSFYIEPEIMTEDSEKVWLGFDLGGTKMLAVLYNHEFKALGRKRRKTKGSEGAEGGMDRVISTIERAFEESEISIDRLEAIGIGCPGPIDMANGRFLHAPNMGWTNVDVAAQLEKRFGCPVAVLNDVDAGVYGEYRFGAAEGSRCSVGIFPGTGIGGGCVYEGNILQGAGISCMEIGHTRISSSTRISGFGMSGTLEAEASRLTVAAEAVKAAYRGEAPYLLANGGTDLSDIRSGTLAAAIENGDKSVRKLVETASETIGFAVVNIIHLLAPDKIILGGGLVEAMEELIVGTVKKTARANVMGPYKDSFDVVAAKLGDDAGAIGAAAWAMKKCTEGNKVER